jgi:hypothetical protein
VISLISTRRVMFISTACCFLSCRKKIGTRLPTSCLHILPKIASGQDKKRKETWAMRTHRHGSKIKVMVAVIPAIAVLFFFQRPARAVPSYARQTGMSCNMCHTMFPELTSFGRTFKASGYTLSQMKKIKSAQTENLGPLELNDTFPLSIMVQTAYTRTDKSQPDTQNDDIQFPQQLSLFLAGEITSHIGSFIQATYTQVDDHITMDNSDLRFASQSQIYGKPLVYGLTLNNNPTVADLWNSTPAWGFPYASADNVPGPAAGALIDGALGQEVAGLGAYGFYSNSWYVSAALYRSAQIGQTSPPDDTSEDTIEGVAPYWRLAWQHNMRPGEFELGTYGLYAQIYPSGVSGDTNRYADYGFDFSFTRPFDKDRLSLHGTYIYEDQSLDATVSSDPNHHLNTFRVDANYYLRGIVGLTAAYFEISGDANPGLYTPGAVDGSRNGKPDSDGWIGQVSYYPWQNVRLSVQYTWYTRFNGSSDNYDGFGRDATDNNTLYVLAWLLW